MLYETLYLPFHDYGFMRRALAACIAMSASSAPLGVFLVLRRMSLIGDAAAHAILPGTAIAFLLTGVALWPMTLGGLIAGLLMALAAGIVTHVTSLKEDASFTAAYLTSLAFGVMLISLKGSAVDLMHVLFGNVLAVDTASLALITGMVTVSILVFAFIYRPLIVECFDASFLKMQQGKGAFYHNVFLVLVVLNLVASFQALGTMMAVGIMILPAIATRFWTRNIDTAVVLSVLFAACSCVIGLLFSYHFNLPSGPAIVLTASAWYVISLFMGSVGGILTRFFPRKHFH